MAHQFGQNRQLDAQWLALTERVSTAGARWLDSLFSAFPSPTALLESAGSRDGQDAVATLRRELELCAPITLPSALRRGAPLWLVTTQDAEYPPLLAECEDRPPFLFVRGRLESLLAQSLSVVGTRKPSLGGRRATADLVTAAVAGGRVIVSGLALGIDGIAHDVAVRSGGTSIAVLPCGIDRIYPQRHAALAEQLTRQGAVVSEFPLRTPPRKHHFHRRNRTLSGFSVATLVVEAGRPSGTLLTASAAADQGRDVLTLPWSIYHSGAAGCRYLLSDGAVLIQSAEDLLSHLGVTRDTVTVAPPPDEPLFTQQAEGPSLASSATEPDQQALLTLLGAETHTVEACATALGWQMERCLSGLVALEVAGKVARAPHGYCALP